MSENDISLRPITLEEYSTIQEQILADYNNKYVRFSDYSSNLIGIYFENILVGLLRLGLYAGNIAPDIYILEKYRGNHIAEYALQHSLALGENYPQFQYFWLTINPQNQSAMSVAKKLGWTRTYGFDEAMIAEGGEFFAIFETENPYYVEERSVKL